MAFEQARRGRAHIERILLVCGAQNAGKSKMLRSMFYDVRLGEDGEPPEKSRVELKSLSNERCVVFRFTSPHEYGDTLNEFLSGIDEKAGNAWDNGYWRFNYASAIQPDADNNMPDVVETCRAMSRQLCPERIRIVQIHPQQNEKDGTLLLPDQVEQLWELGCEVVTVSAQHRPRGPETNRVNGLFLSDFFDFT